MRKLTNLLEAQQEGQGQWCGKPKPDRGTHWLERREWEDDGGALEEEEGD